MVIKVVMLLLFFGLMVFIGLHFRKKASNVENFVLGGRKIGPWISAFSFGTSYFSAVIFVGYAGRFGWDFGTAATWIGLGNAFIGSLLAWVVLGRRTRIMTNHLNSATMPEFFGARYISPALKIGASIIVFVFLIPYTASLYNGLSQLFTMAFNIPFVVCIVIMGALTAVYVVAGGYFAQAVNDFIQGIIMIGGIIIVVAAVLNDNGGFSAAISELSRIETADAAANPGVLTSFFGPDPVSLLAVVILTSLGTWGLPQMVARFYSIKSEKMISKGTVISTVFAIIIAGGCYFLGSFGRLYADEAGIILGDGKVNFDAIVPTMLERFPDMLIGLAVLLVLAASMSTLSSLVIASSSTFTLDFLKGNIIKKMSEKTQLLVIRVLIVVFIAISSVIAIITSNPDTRIAFIADLMGISWGALAGSFLAPFLFGLYWKRTTKASVWCCFAFSTLLMIANVLFRSHFPALLQSPINAGAFAMLAGIIIVPLVSLFTRKPDNEVIENQFACYETEVHVKVKDDLGEQN